MNYPYYDYSSAQFEQLIVWVCKRILGTGAIGYPLGKDSGKDVSFFGTAAEIPNRTSPWQGKFIVQAKHTDKPFAKFTDTDFYSETSKTNHLAKELPKIKRLFDKKELDYYLLFANRTLPGGADTQIKKYISANTGVPQDHILLYGTGHLDDFLKQFPEIVSWADIDPVDFPLSVSPADLADIILRLVDGKDDVVKTSKSKEIPIRTPLDQKAVLNNMTTDYTGLIKQQIKNFHEIHSFLESDDQSREMYESVIEELNAEIVSKRRDYQHFDEIIQHIYKLYVNRDSDLKRHQKTLRLLLYYMFWYCDIGRNDEND